MHPYLVQVTGRAAYHLQSYSSIGSRQVSKFGPKIGAATFTRATKSEVVKLVVTLIKTAIQHYCVVLLKVVAPQIGAKTRNILMTRPFFNSRELFF
jgi:hypothetical protein